MSATWGATTRATSRPAGEPAPRAGESGYRPELDGIRAIAMILVIAFHAGMASMVGGYLGVDVFFVLSGFLITGLLLTAGDAGAVGLVKFYSRRARRLLPVAAVVLVVTAGLWVAIASSVEREPLVGDIRSAALYFSNWHFAHQATDYFASADDPSPFVHFWSLSAEEQFYLVWPALIALAYLGARGSKRRAAWIVAALAGTLMVASLVSLVLTTRHGDSSYAYFATNNRAYQLLAGALLAVWAHRRRAHRVRHGEPALGAAPGPELGGGYPPPPNGNGNGSARGDHGVPVQAAGRHASPEYAVAHAGPQNLGPQNLGPQHLGAQHSATATAPAHPTALAVGIARGAHAARPAGTAGAERAIAGTSTWILAGAIQLITVAALIVVASSQIGLGPGARGALGAGITLVLLAALELLPTGAGGWLLGRAPLAYIGRISYGAYLWHWPVILVIRRFALVNPHQLFLLAGVLSISLASLSHRLLEEPIRRSPALARRPKFSITAGLAMSLVIALLIGPQLLSSTRKPVIFPVSAPAAAPPAGAPAKPPVPGLAIETGALPPARTKTPVPDAAAIKAASDAYGTRVCEQEIEDAGRGCLDHTGSPGRPKVMVIGDSHLEAFFQPFDQLAVEQDFTLYTWIYYVCPWETGVLPKDAGNSKNADACRTRKAELRTNMLARYKPDVVITLNRGYDDPNYPRELFLDGQPNQTNPGKVLAKAAGPAATDILRYAKKLVVLEPWPSLKFSQRSCLSAQQFVEACRALAAPTKLPSELAFEKLAASDSRISTVDLDHVVCPNLPVCDAVQGGILARRDVDHITNPFALSIKPQLAAELRRVGVFGP